LQKNTPEAQCPILERRGITFTLNGTPLEARVTTGRVVARLSREEEERLIKHTYRMQGERGLLIKTLFQTGARVSSFVNLKVEDVFFEEQMILIAKAKGGKSHYVPILPELAQELRTHLGQRTVGYLFETNRATRYSPRRIQYMVKETAESPSACIRISSGTRWQRRS
jgi:integrase/recombinase XerD